MHEDDISMGEVGGLLADIRDMFPVPGQGSELEEAWTGAMACPEYVPAYVKACVAVLYQKQIDMLGASAYSADWATQALETVSEQQVFIESLISEIKRLKAEIDQKDADESDMLMIAYMHGASSRRNK